MYSNCNLMVFREQLAFVANTKKCLLVCDNFGESASFDTCLRRFVVFLLV